MGSKPKSNTAHHEDRIAFRSNGVWVAVRESSPFKLGDRDRLVLKVQGTFKPITEGT